jgi:ElaB/YqjD/DUF883 family membrane-anchored ribosome-binding protein
MEPHDENHSGFNEQLDPNKRTVETWLQLIDSHLKSQGKEITKLQTQFESLNTMVSKIQATIWKIIGLSVGIGIVIGIIIKEVQEFIDRIGSLPINP